MAKRNEAARPLPPALMTDAEIEMDAAADKENPPWIKAKIAESGVLGAERWRKALRFSALRGC